MSLYCGASIMNQVKDVVADLKGIPTRDKLIELLRKEVVEVTFTKLDGDERRTYDTSRSIGQGLCSMG